MYEYVIVSKEGYHLYSKPLYQQALDLILLLGLKDVTIKKRYY